MAVPGTNLPKDWVFRQLGGQKKQFALAGWSAPFGRARKSPILSDEIKVRQKTTYYPGTDAAPTRHVFGLKYEPWELNGRFMDTEVGPGYANQQTAYVRLFVADQQQIAISWGTVLNVEGFIESFAVARESESQVAWKMKLLIDQDYSAVPAVPFVNVDSPRSYLPDLTQMKIPIPTKPPIIKPSLLDSLSDLVASFNGAIASLVSVVSSIDSFEKAILGDIKRLRAGIGQLRTAALALRNTISSIQTNSLLISRSAGSDIQGLSYVTQTDVDLIRTLGRMAALDRQAAIAERGKAVSSYVAQLGDTWESLSIRFFGAPDKAQKLREINGAKYGLQPEPGRALQVPFY